MDPSEPSAGPWISPPHQELEKVKYAYATGAQPARYYRKKVDLSSGTPVVTFQEALEAAIPASDWQPDARHPNITTWAEWSYATP